VTIEENFLEGDHVQQKDISGDLVRVPGSVSDGWPVHRSPGEESDDSLDAGRDGDYCFLAMKAFLLDLVDEVYDFGDYLVVKNRGEEDHIPLSNIMNVSASFFTNPPRITLKLASPSKFGDDIIFSPVVPFTFNPFAKNPVAEDLIIRVDRARLRRRS
jgi:hypothetical protein